MTSIADPNTKTRLTALQEERHDILERLQDLLAEAELHGLAGQMDRRTATRERIRAAGEHLGIVNEQIAALTFGRSSRALPARTNSWQVER